MTAASIVLICATPLLVVAFVAALKISRHMEATRETDDFDEVARHGHHVMYWGAIGSGSCFMFAATAFVAAAIR